MDGPTEKVNETFQKSDRIYDKNGQKKIAEKLAVKKLWFRDNATPQREKLQRAEKFTVGSFFYL